MTSLAVNLIMGDVQAELRKQNHKWGAQRHLPFGTSELAYSPQAEVEKAVTDYANQVGEVTWAQILREEVAEFMAEEDLARMRAELVQIAAVAVAVVEDIDSRTKGQ